MLLTIALSVGKGGVNHVDDVKTVQDLLNANITIIPPLAPLTVDGLVGPKTIQVLEEFQRRVVGMARPDGRVDPGGPTFHQLTLGAEKLAYPFVVKMPCADGEVVPFAVIMPPNPIPRIYYVNGMQTDALGHAATATGLAMLTERVVYGVYNATAGLGRGGFVIDLLQCGGDWFLAALPKPAEPRKFTLSTA